MADLLSDADVGFTSGRKLLSDADVGFASGDRRAEASFARYNEPGTETGPAAEAPRSPAPGGMADYREPGTGPDAEAPATSGPLSRIAGAAAQGWSDTPSVVGPAAQDFFDKSAVGSQIVSPALKLAAGVVPGPWNPNLNAGIAALSQAAMEVFGEKGGRDALALLSSLPMIGGERMSPEVAAKAAEAPRPRFVSERAAPDVSELDPRNAISTLIQHDIAENPPAQPGRGMANQGAAATIPDVLSAPDLDTAIAAANSASQAPARVTATQVAARDGVGINEAYRRAVAENAREKPPVQEAAPSIEPPAAPALTGEVLPPARAPQTSAEAKQIASAHYQRADEVGGTLTPEFVNRFVDKAESIAPQTAEGQMIVGDSPITALVDRIQGLRDEPVSLKGAQEIDEGLGNLIDREFGVKGLSKEGKQLLDLQTTFRNMILDAGPDDVGGGTAGFDALKQGRAAWAQAMKMTDLERIQDRAELTDNPATSIRSGIRVLLSNPSRVRGYSPAEVAALKDAANRGVMGSVLHVFGSRLIPAGLAAHGAVSLSPASLATAAVAHAGTSLLRNAATGLQSRRLGNAMDVLGQSVPPAP